MQLGQPQLGFANQRLTSILDINEVQDDRVVLAPARLTAGFLAASAMRN